MVTMRSMEIKNVSKRVFMSENVVIKPEEVGVLDASLWFDSSYIKTLVERGDIILVNPPPPKKRKRNKPS